MKDVNITPFGYEVGDVCNRKEGKCKGIIEEHETDRSCSCHINPPCSFCTDPRQFCPVCEWEAADEVKINGFHIQTDKSTGVHKSWERRPLDPTKIDYHTFSHTHFSMIRRGVYPPGTTQPQVLEKVKGTFGGRFTRFGGGHFEYIAYTD